MAHVTDKINSKLEIKLHGVDLTLILACFPSFLLHSLAILFEKSMPQHRTLHFRLGLECGYGDQVRCLVPAITCVSITLQ